MNPMNLVDPVDPIVILLVYPMDLLYLYQVHPVVDPMNPLELLHGPT